MLLDELSLSVAESQSVAILGRSGSGKTSLLAVLGLLSEPDSGALTIGGVNALGLKDSQRSRLRNQALGFVFQSYSLIPHLTAAENIALPLWQGDRLTRREIARRVRDVMELVNIAHRKDSMPAQLSGGEQQRTAIARALVGRPAIVLADEPTGALDTATGDHVLDVLLQSCVVDDVALILVTHDEAVASRTTARYELCVGKLRELL